MRRIVCFLMLGLNANAQQTLPSQEQQQAYAQAMIQSLQGDIQELTPSYELFSQCVARGESIIVGSISQDAYHWLLDVAKSEKSTKNIKIISYKNNKILPDLKKKGYEVYILNITIPNSVFICPSILTDNILNGKTGHSVQSSMMYAYMRDFIKKQLMKGSNVSKL